MSSVRTMPAAQAGDVEVLVNKKANTVTFVGDRSDAESVPPTEWITVSAETVVDLKSQR